MSTTKVREKQSTKTITQPSSFAANRWTGEVEAAVSERRPGEDIWTQNGRLLSEREVARAEREEARAAAAAVVLLGRDKKLSKANIEGIMARYPWIAEKVL